LDTDYDDTGVLRIYHGANHAKSSGRCLGLILRNMDKSPDYFYTDFYFKNEERWVKGYGLINTFVYEGRKEYSCSRKINRTVTDELGNNKTLNVVLLTAKYFGGSYHCL